MESALAHSGREYREAIGGGEVPPPPIAVLGRMQPVERGDATAVSEARLLAAVSGKLLATATRRC